MEILRKYIGYCGLLLCLCGALCSSCEEKDGTILPRGIALKEGDIVFRQGESISSLAIRNIDREGCYSHIGIVVDSAGCPMIVHAVPDELDFPGDVDRVKMDFPNQFFLKSRANIGEVMRPHNQKAAHRAAQIAWQIYHRHTLFDHEYDDQDSSKMYCTELVLFVYKEAGIDLSTGTREQIDFPIDFDGYLPSAIHESPELFSIRKF